MSSRLFLGLAFVASLAASCAPCRRPSGAPDVPMVSGVYDILPGYFSDGVMTVDTAAGTVDLTWIDESGTQRSALLVRER